MKHSRKILRLALIAILAIVSVFNKDGLLDLAKGLAQRNVRILASGGTAKMIREGGFAVDDIR